MPATITGLPLFDSPETTSSAQSWHSASMQLPRVVLNRDADSQTSTSVHYSTDTGTASVNTASSNPRRPEKDSADRDRVAESSPHVHSVAASSAPERVQTPQTKIKIVDGGIIARLKAKRAAERAAQTPSPEAASPLVTKSTPHSPVVSEAFGPTPSALPSDFPPTSFRTKDFWVEAPKAFDESTKSQVLARMREQLAHRRSQSYDATLFQPLDHDSGCEQHDDDAKTSSVARETSEPNLNAHPSSLDGSLSSQSPSSTRSDPPAIETITPRGTPLEDWQFHALSEITERTERSTLGNTSRHSNSIDSQFSKWSFRPKSSSSASFRRGERPVSFSGLSNISETRSDEGDLAKRSGKRRSALIAQAVETFEGGQERLSTASGSGRTPRDGAFVLASPSLAVSAPEALSPRAQGSRVSTITYAEASAAVLCKGRLLIPPLDLADAFNNPQLWQSRLCIFTATYMTVHAASIDDKPVLQLATADITCVQEQQFTSFAFKPFRVTLRDGTQHDFACSRGADRVNWIFALERAVAQSPGSRDSWIRSSGTSSIRSSKKDPIVQAVHDDEATSRATEPACPRITVDAEPRDLFGKLNEFQASNSGASAQYHDVDRFRAPEDLASTPTAFDRRYPPVSPLRTRQVSSLPLGADFGVRRGGQSISTTAAIPTMSSVASEGRKSLERSLAEARLEGRSVADSREAEPYTPEGGREWQTPRNRPTLTRDSPPLAAAESFESVDEQRRRETSHAPREDLIENVLHAIKSSDQHISSANQERERLGVFINTLAQVVTDARNDNEVRLEDILTAIYNLRQDVQALPSQVASDLVSSSNVSRPQSESIDRPLVVQDVDDGGSTSTLVEQFEAQVEAQEAAAAAKQRVRFSREYNSDEAARESLVGAQEAKQKEGQDGLVLEDEAELPKRRWSLTRTGSGKTRGPRMPNVKLWGGIDSVSQAEHAARWGGTLPRTLSAASNRLREVSEMGTAPQNQGFISEKPVASFVDAIKSDEGLALVLENLSKGDVQIDNATMAVAILEVLSRIRDSANQQTTREQMDQDERSRYNGLTRKERNDSEARRSEIHRLEALAQMNGKRQAQIEESIARLSARAEQQTKMLQDLVRNSNVNGQQQKGKGREESLSSDEEIRKLFEQVKAGVDDQVKDFRTQLTSELHKMLTEVGRLREEKKNLQTEIADLLSFQARYSNSTASHSPEAGPDVAATNATASSPVPRTAGAGPALSFFGPRAMNK
ncbi:hypothetical protein ACM66B_005370 [Microbotryomycetes sp. NB124-2]